MGAVDIRMKEFVKINSVFAELFGKGVFGGRVRIDPDKLRELDTVNQETVKLGDGRLKSMERLRDVQKISKLFDGRMTFQVIMGVEGQDGVNYFMPVRCMELDALTYSLQCRQISNKAKESNGLEKYAAGVPRGTKILPAVTLVFYCGSKRWDGPVSVYDMLDIPEELKGWAKTIIPDYPMHLIDARHMTDEEIDQFDGDLKAFLVMIQENFDEKKWKSVVAMHRETWYAIGTIKRDRRYIEYIDSVSDEELAGGVYMDAVLDRIEARGEARGKVEGKRRVNQLNLLLFKDGRVEDILKSSENDGYQKQLFHEYGLDDE